ncbi:hypothetical protein X731_03795 [Mesorhizobium sp. L2C054A000]|nr:hypothetical protein [Mesorhizobium sp. L2C054A000]ESZ51711.1 hypothetical protein X731_03795 [Mesorhizobium sp. L2C054A000]
MGWWSSSGSSDSGSDSVKSSDYDPSLPDNKAEAQAARDAAKESTIEKSWSDTKAKESNDSLMSSIFGKK